MELNLRFCLDSNFEDNQLLDYLINLAVEKEINVAGSPTTGITFFSFENESEMLLFMNELITLIKINFSKYVNELIFEKFIEEKDVFIVVNRLIIKEN